MPWTACKPIRPRGARWRWRRTETYYFEECEMFGKRWRLFRLLGIPISVDASWLVILALVAWSLAEQFHQRYQMLHPWNYWIMGFVTALAFFLCIVLHELGHAVVARAFGMPIRGI